MPTFYVTTPIYYVNDTPHIGHAYTTVAADVLARYKRLKGLRVLFLTGTDEHGQKVERAASEAGLTPTLFVDGVVERFRALWQALNISNDDFIRTTEARHMRAAVRLWQEIVTNGDIYPGEYEDWYCTPCENFLTETQLSEGQRCPDCSRPVERLREKSYFFRLSKYRERLLEHIEQNPDFIRPESRRNEITSFIKGGLRDLSVSRTTFSWGVPVPGDPDHIMYVWIEALSNYLCGAGYPEGPHTEFWPADVHLMGKDILRFHAVFWPAFLMSAGLELPKKIFAHGWWTVDGKKMGKSAGNVVDPFRIINDYGVDQFRYFLMREVPFGLDGDFSMDALKGRINSELANDLGNLLSRTVSMIEKYRGGVIPERGVKDRKDLEAALWKSVLPLSYSIDLAMDNLAFSDALVRLWRVVREMNGYVEKTAPWRLAKEGDEKTLSTVLHTLAEGLRIIALYLYPFMPASSEKIWAALGIDQKIKGSSLDREAAIGSAKIAGLKVVKGAPLFPRVE